MKIDLEEMAKNSNHTGEEGHAFGLPMLAGLMFSVFGGLVGGYTCATGRLTPEKYGIFVYGPALGVLSGALMHFGGNEDGLAGAVFMGEGFAAIEAVCFGVGYGVGELTR